VPHLSLHVNLRVYAALPAAPVFPVEPYLPVRVPASMFYLPPQVDVAPVGYVAVACRTRGEYGLRLFPEVFREPLVGIDEEDPAVPAAVLGVLILFRLTCGIELQDLFRVF